MSKKDRKAIKAGIVTILLFLVLFFNVPFTTLRVRNSVVMVHLERNGFPYGQASGVIVDKGIILTAKHVVRDATKIYITTDDGVKITSTQFVKADDTDLGLIIFDANDIPSQARLSMFSPFIGQTVFGIGNRYGLFNCFFKGVVGSKNVLVPFFGSKKLILLDIAGNSGDSGCPIYNRWGNVVGILVGGRAYADGVTLIVPAKICRLFLNQYRVNKEFKEAK